VQQYSVVLPTGAATASAAHCHGVALHPRRCDGHQYVSSQAATAMHYMTCDDVHEASGVPRCIRPSASKSRQAYDEKSCVDAQDVRSVGMLSKPRVAQP